MNRRDEINTDNWAGCKNMVLGGFAVVCGVIAAIIYWLVA
jgi:hypothetical protein